MFNKLKEVGGKLRERAQSNRSDSGSVSGASIGSGFLCPDCKQTFGEAEQLQTHWLVCLSRSVSLTDISLPEEDTLDLETLGLEELKDLITETKAENRKLLGSNQEIVRRSGAMAMEVGNLQKEIDDITTKCANLEGMSIVMQETYLSQVTRNEELRELLEQRSMTSPDDVQVLTRELSRLHAVLSEKEGEWDTRLSQLSGEASQKQSADLAQSRRETEACQKELVASQLESKRREEESVKLTNQMATLTEEHNQLTEQVANQREEISKLTVEKECNQANAEIANQLERCLTAVSADKQELFEKIGTEALSGALSDTFVQQIQSDLTESRASLRQEKETAARREEQLTNRHLTELRDRESLMSELRAKIDSLRESNDQLKAEGSEGKRRETELTNQLHAVEGEVTTANDRSAEKEKQVNELAAELRGAREELTRASEKQLIEEADRERRLLQEQSKTQDLELELETARKDFVELNRLIDEKESELARTLSRAEKSEEDLGNTLDLKNSLSSQILEMDCKIQELGQQLEEKTLSCSEQKREIETLTEGMDQLGEQLEAGRDTIKKQSEEHESVKSLLIEQKLDLQNKLSLAEGKTRSLEAQLSAERREKETSLVNLQKELQQVTERGDRLTAESAEMRDQLEKEKTLSQLTRTNLQQEISSLRDDVRAGGSERAGLQESLDVQFGRMAVMDAKLQSLKGENQQLIGAQVESDSSLTAYKKRVHEMEVELGDTKSALYEVAKENQKLTLKEAKEADRKWQDDTLIAACSNCNKKFSLSVRKHHCRRCGQIFCNECTLSQADLPSYKGKVRVCDACVRDLYN